MTSLLHRCSCISLRTVALTIGYINLIGTLYIPVALGVDFKWMCHQMGISTHDPHLPLFLVIISATSLICLTCHISLIVGIHKDRPRYVFWYLCFAIFVLVGSLTSLIYQIVQGAPVDYKAKGLSVLLQLIYLIVIRSYYILMKKSDGQSNIIENEENLLVRTC